jgi:hypothetical protein
LARKTCTIRYYRAEQAPVAAGRWPQDGNVARVLNEALDKTPRTPYIDHDGHSFIVERHANSPLHVSVATVRRDNLPFLERDGHTSALPLPRGDNLAEPTHFVFFGDRIVAMVRSQTTPRHITGAIVLSERGDIPLAFAPILRPEIEALVMNSIEVAQLELRVAGSSFNRAAAEAGDPIEAVHQMTAKFSGAGVARVTLRATTAPDRQRFRSWLIRQLQGGAFADGAEAAKAKVIDRDGQRQMVDLIEDQIAHTATVMTNGVTRHLNPGDVYDAVQRNFEEQRAVLTRAIEMSRE